MYPLRIIDNDFYVGERWLGDILEVTVIAAGSVNGNDAQYTFRLEDNNEVLINVPVHTDIDKFLGITMLKPVWIWCCENELKAEISNYARLERYRRPGGK